MIIQCGHCQSRYSLPDDTVAGRKLKFRCRKCQKDLVIDGTGFSMTRKSAPPPSAEPLQGAPTVQSVLPIPPDALSPKSIPPAPTVPGAPNPFEGMTVPKSQAPRHVHDALTVPRAAIPSAPPARSPSVPAGPKMKVAVPGVKPGSVPPPALRPASVPPPAFPQPTKVPSIPPPAKVPSIPPPSAIPGAIALPPPARLPSLADAPPLPELPTWFLAVGATPEGPLTKSEVEKRLRDGRCDERTLAWREGQGAWAALAKVPELAALAPPRTRPFSDRPPRLDPEDAPEAPRVPETRPKEAEPDLRLPPTPSSSDSDEEATLFVARPRSLPPGPLHIDEAAEAHAGARRSPAPGDIPPQVEHSVAASADVVESPPASVAASSGRGWLVAFVVALAAGLACAWFLFGPSSDERSSATGIEGVAPGTIEEVAQPSAPGGGPTIDLDSVADDDPTVEAPTPTEGAVPESESTTATTPHVAPLAPGPPTGDPTDAPAAPPVRPAPTPAGEATPVPAPTPAQPAASAQPPDAAAVSAVVRQNRNRLTHCYEQAATMANQSPDVRVVVNVRFARSGAVERVEVDGSPFGGMIPCIQRMVQAWTFPASGTGGQTSFTLAIAGS